VTAEGKVGVVTVGISDEIFYPDLYVLQTGGATETSEKGILGTDHLTYSVAYTEVQADKDGYLLTVNFSELYTPLRTDFNALPAPGTAGRVYPAGILRSKG